MKLKTLLDSFEVETENVKKINDNLYKVEDFQNTFIIHSKEALRIACFPSVVGKNLERNCEKLSLTFVKNLRRLNLIKNEILIYNILRASLGYKVSKHFKKFSQIWVRPKYVEYSYRNHRIRKIEILYRNFSELDKNKKYDLVIADTVATGFTLIKSLKEIEKFFNNIEKVIIYGFISVKGLNEVKKFLEKNKIEYYFFAISNITDLAFNNYDMVLYGLDESFYSQFKRKRYLAGITSEEILKQFYKFYIPGLDEPGDFSARQLKLFDGYKILDNREEIVNHLKKNKEIIKKIYQISKDEKWFCEVHKKRIREEINKINSILLHGNY